MRAMRVRGSKFNMLFGLVLAFGLMTACSPAADSGTETAPAAESLDPVETAPEGVPAETIDAPADAPVDPGAEAAPGEGVVEDEGVPTEGAATEEPTDPEAETPQD
jgi:hypothetical protein